MDCGAADFNSYHRIEGTNCSLKGFEIAILVGKDAKVANVYAKANTSVYILLRRLEPGITLCLPR